MFPVTIARPIRLFAFLFVFFKSPAIDAELIQVFKDVNGIPTGLVYGGPSENFAPQLKDLNQRSPLDTVEWVSFSSATSVSGDQVAALKHFNSIKSIDIGYYPDGVEVAEDFIVKLENVPNLEKLEIHGRLVGNPEFTNLASLQKLKVLSLTGEIITRPFQLLPLGNASDLTYLALECRCDVEDFDWLERMEQLEHLRLQAPRLSDKIVNCLSKLTKLKSLTIDGFVFRDEDLKVLVSKGGKDIEYLDLQLEENSSIDTLVRFNHLKSLSLFSPGQQEIGIDFLLKLPAIEFLQLQGWVPSKGLNKELHRHPTLKRLLFSGE